MRSSVYSKHRGWKRLYSTKLPRDEQIHRGKELEIELSKNRSKKGLNRAHIDLECQLIRGDKLCDSFYCPRSMAQDCCLNLL